KMGARAEGCEYRPVRPKKIQQADALLFDPGEKPGLVEFLLHPVPHCETWRRLFPCDEKFAGSFLPGFEHSGSWRGAPCKFCMAWWTCRFVGSAANRQRQYYTRLAAKSQGRIS